VRSSPPLVVAGLALMCAAMLARAVSWHAILRAALPDARPRLTDAVQGTSIGVLMSATLPARLGEPSRALVVARRLGRPRDRLPVVLGTLVSQTLINVVALVILGAVMFTTVGLFAGRQQALVWYALAPLGILFVVLLAPALLRSGLPSRSARVCRWLGQARLALARVRSGLRVFARPREGLVAIGMQLSAWALQWVACYVLLAALGLGGQADMGAAAAVLFAVNVTAVVPVTPSNLGVFQAACVAVLAGAYGMHAADALGYGIVLQAVEIATAVIMGAPALVKEGVSWREIRLRTLHSTPVSLSAPPQRAEAEA
jgi:phosphatidylinositol alpha-mannosyltransferase